MPRKYERLFKTLPLVEDEIVEKSPDDDTQGPAFYSLGGSDYLMDDEATSHIELTVIGRKPPLASNMGVGMQFTPPPDYACRYYGGAFHSRPYQPPTPHMMSYLSLDPDAPGELGATIEAWTGEGDDAEQYIFDKPTSVFFSTDRYTGPLVMRNVEKPFLLFVTVSYPLHTARAKDTLPTKFRLEEMVRQPTPPGGRHKNFCSLDPTKVVVPPSHRGKVVPLMLFDAYDHEQAQETIDVRVIRSAGIGFGIGEATGDPLYEFSTWPIKHPFEKTIILGSLDGDRRDLGGVVEFWIGEGDEAEKYVIDKPTTIHIPKNTLHFPMFVREWRKDIIFTTVTKMPIFAGKWSRELPAGFTL